MTVGDALARFAIAYGGTGYQLSGSELKLLDANGKSLAAGALLPCGLPAGADVFVKSSAAPVALSSDMAAAATAASKAACAAAANPAVAVAAVPAAGTSAASAAAAPAAGPPAKGVYAKPGSAIAASQAKMGENSYYYSVGRTKANSAATASGAPVVAAPAEAEPRVPKKVVAREVKLPEQTISSYSFLDDETVAKIHVNLAGAGLLPEGAISCSFRERSFDLRVTSDGKILRLHIPILGEEIKEAEASVLKKTSKLIIKLPKREAKGWYELRKTKGVGDTEYHKITPDAGESVVFTL